MSKISFEELLLQTTFSCMICDGDIDPTEIKLIRSLHEVDQVFEVDDIELELNNRIKDVNQNGQKFLREYLNALGTTELNEAQEIEIARTAVKTIKADNEEKYSEFKFFKILRTKLKVSDKVLLNSLSEFDNLNEDYLEQDIISESYIQKLTSTYFDENDLPQFDEIKLDGDETK